MILVIGHALEPTTAHTLDRAARTGVPHHHLDLTGFVRAGRVDIKEMTVFDGARTFELARYTAIYQRLIFDRVYCGRLTAARQFRFNTLVEIVRRCHGAGVARVYSAPLGADPNSSKIMQTLEMGQSGFCVPISLATTSPQAARDFCQRPASRIYKSLSADRSVVSAAPPRRSPRYERLRSAPALFQELVVGADVRLHAVGGEFIGEKITSEQIDYRYASGNTHVPINVPYQVAGAIGSYMGLHGLLFVGVDFKLTPGGRWIALEINTMPGYSGYDQRCGNRISAALFAAMGKATGT